jgi:hypothetical protein
MNDDKRPSFPHLDRRANYLRQELYEHDKYWRNPPAGSDPVMQIKFSNDAEDHQAELDELMYLRSFADKASRPTGIKTWQAVVLAFYTTISLVLAAVSFWMVMIR